MKVKVLAENTAVSGELGKEHGLSLYVERGKNKILFDVGAGSLFLDNAKKLDVNISEVEYLVISHGHYDHGGGLKYFLEHNDKAGVFIHNRAFRKHYALRDDDIKYIGLDEDLLKNKRITLTQERFIISKDLELFTNSIAKEPKPASNKGLFMESEEGMIDDDFAHEQSLIIEEDGKTLLITGCAHNGIINIIEQFNMLKGYMPHWIIGGFHLSSRSSKGGESYESPDVIHRLGNKLKDTGVKFYTCHCTGIEPYKDLKTIMGEKIEYISGGQEIVLG